MSGGPSFADVVNPTSDEIRAWAYSGRTAPMEDWEIIIAEPANVSLFITLVADTLCPSRSYILLSLYCTVGHSDRSGPWLHEAVLTAEHSTEPWLRTWARRVREIVERPESFDRKDWCGWPGYVDGPPG